MADGITCFVIKKKYHCNSVFYLCSVPYILSEHIPPIVKENKKYIYLFFRCILFTNFAIHSPSIKNIILEIYTYIGMVS